MGLCLAPDRSHREERPAMWKLPDPITTVGRHGILFGTAILP